MAFCVDDREMLKDLVEMSHSSLITSRRNKIGRCGCSENSTPPPPVSFLMYQLTRSVATGLCSVPSAFRFVSLVSTMHPIMMMMWCQSVLETTFAIRHDAQRWGYLVVLLILTGKKPSLWKRSMLQYGLPIDNSKNQSIPVQEIKPFHLHMCRFQNSLYSRLFRLSKTQNF